MTHSEVNSSLQLTVAREFKKYYRLFHRATQISEKDFASDETALRRFRKKTDYAGFS